MPDAPRARLRRWTAVALSTVVVSGAVWVAGPMATAEPRRTIAEVEAQLTALETKAEMAQEQYNGAQIKLDAINRKLSATKKRVDASRKAFASEQAAVGQLAAQAYRAGGVDVSVQILMAEDPQDFLRQATAVEQLAKSQNTTLRRTAAARLQLAQATTALGQQQAEAEAVVAQMKQAKAEVDTSVEETKTLLGQLKEEERKRLAAIAAQRRAESERAAAAARAEAEARASRDRPSSSSSSSSSGGDYSAPAGDVPASSRAAIAVQYALAQVGKSYSYNADPPNSWDCSKLTAAAWGRAGVSLTAYSYDQANEVRRISTSELRPGDLLFYFNDAHHVSMYIGGGQIVEAASPSSGVKVSSLWNGWNRSHFSFAGRPVG